MRPCSPRRIRLSAENKFRVTKCRFCNSLKGRNPVLKAPGFSPRFSSANPPECGRVAEVTRLHGNDERKKYADLLGTDHYNKFLFKVRMSILCRPFYNELYR